MARPRIHDAQQVRDLYDAGKSYEEIKAISGIKSDASITRLLSDTGGTRKQVKKTSVEIYKMTLTCLVPKEIYDYYTKLRQNQLLSILQSNLPYSQTGGGSAETENPEQNCRIAKQGVVDEIQDFAITFLDSDGMIISKRTIHCYADQLDEIADRMMQTINLAHSWRKD